MIAVVAQGCTAITVRPTYRPFPLATFDTVTAKPPDIVAGAAEEVTRLGVAVRVGPVTSPLAGDVLPFTPWMSRDAGAPISNPETPATQRDQQRQ